MFRKLHTRLICISNFTIDPFKSDTWNHVWRDRDSILEQIHGCFKFISEKRVSDWPTSPKEISDCTGWILVSQGRVNADSGGYVVVLHFDHDFFVHCQLGRVPHCREDGFADRERRGSCKADENQIRSSQRRQHRGLFQGKIGWITHESFTDDRVIVFLSTRCRSSIFRYSDVYHVRNDDSWIVSYRKRTRRKNRLGIKVYIILHNCTIFYVKWNLDTFER